MSKNSNKPSTKKQDIQVKKEQQSLQGTNDESQWVRNFVAISYSLQPLGKGLCWIFGSLLILAIVVFVFMGDVTPQELLEIANMYFKK